MRLYYNRTETITFAYLPFRLKQKFALDVFAKIGEDDHRMALLGKMYLCNIAVAHLFYITTVCRLCEYISNFACHA